MVDAVNNYKEDGYYLNSIIRTSAGSEELSATINQISNSLMKYQKQSKSHLLLLILLLIRIWILLKSSIILTP